MLIASRIFRWAAIYGVIVLIPMFFTAARFGQDYPPPLTHVEFYYGFAGLALAWQTAFYVIGSDPVRFRPLMIPAVIEKYGWGLIVFGMIALGHAIPAPTVVLAVIDVSLGSAFLYAWRLTAA